MNMRMNMTRPKGGLILMTMECLLVILLVALTAGQGHAAEEKQLRVYGDVTTELTLSIDDFTAMPSFDIRWVAFLSEKDSCESRAEQQVSVDDYRGVLLRDLLYKAGVKHKFKWEPGVYFIVRGTNAEKMVFSFGEIFYSSIGRSVLVALEKNLDPIEFSKGCGSLVVSTDIRSGRWIPEIAGIEVRRVDVEMEAYKDKQKQRMRPPEESLVIRNTATGRTMTVDRCGMMSLTPVMIPGAVMTGDCEGFSGVYAFSGPSLRSVLEMFGIRECPPAYDRYVLVKSSDGFCATFSFGEIFNSRMSNNLIVAVQKDHCLLDERDGFARTVVGEDSTGGRSVKRISEIQIHAIQK